MCRRPTLMALIVNCAKTSPGAKGVDAGVGRGIVTRRRENALAMMILKECVGEIRKRAVILKICRIQG
jgi:hypothetical protein